MSVPFQRVALCSTGESIGKVTQLARPAGVHDSSDVISVVGRLSERSVGSEIIPDRWPVGGRDITVYNVFFRIACMIVALKRLRNGF